jgi:hypothetical protein
MPELLFASVKFEFPESADPGATGVPTDTELRYSVINAELTVAAT